MTGQSPQYPLHGPVMLGALAIIAMMIILLGWGTQARLQGAVVAPGRIEVALNRQVVQHPDGGVVSEILVAEGARVAAGDVLIRLDGSALQSELAIVQGQISELAARRARLLAERDETALQFSADLLFAARSRAEVAEQVDGQRRLFLARRDGLTEERTQLDRRIDQIRAQIDGITAQRTALNTQIGLIRDERKSQQHLFDKGLAAQGTLLALAREEARLQGQIGEMAAASAEAETRITETEIEITRLASRRREDAAAALRDIGPAELELAERRRALADRIARLDLRAPVAGVVLGLQVTTDRAVIRAAEAVLYLVPQDRPLVVTAEIAPQHIDEVTLGQSVELGFSAFSARSTPRLHGTVSQISADALTHPETRAAFYRVEIRLAPGEEALLGGQQLLPGMPVEVYLKTGAHTPLAYLLKPFTEYFARAFRES